MSEDVKKTESKAARKAAPPIIVGDVHRDDRAAILAELNSADPEFVHSYVSGVSNLDHLSRKGQEVVKGKDGQPIRHESDIVVKASREAYDKTRARESEESLGMSSRVVRDPNEIRQKRDPKKVRVRQEED